MGGGGDPWAELRWVVLGAARTSKHGQDRVTLGLLLRAGPARQEHPSRHLTEGKTQSSLAPSAPTVPSDPAADLRCRSGPGAPTDVMRGRRLRFCGCYPRGDSVSVP